LYIGEKTLYYIPSDKYPTHYLSKIMSKNTIYHINDFWYKIINLKNAINIESPKAKNDVERSNTIIYNGNQSQKMNTITEEEKGKINNKKLRKKKK